MCARLTLRSSCSTRPVAPADVQTRARTSTPDQCSLTRIYTGDDGESHFEDVEIPLEDRGVIGAISALHPASGIAFRETEGSCDFGHTAPRRQYIVNLEGIGDSLPIPPAVGLPVGT